MNIKNILSSLIVFTSIVAASFATAKDINQGDLQALLEAKSNLVLLDVRAVSEYNDGHLPKAINIPHVELQDRLAEVSADKDTQVVIYCRSGRRAEIARQLLEKNGFTQLDHLSGDYNGWRAANLPIVKPSQVK